MRARIYKIAVLMAIMLATLSSTVSSQTGRGQRKQAKPSGPTIRRTPGRVESLDFTTGPTSNLGS